MSTITVSNSVEKLLHELSFQSSEEVMKESLATEILARMAAFRSEVEHFAEKYGQSLETVRAEYESGEENFEVYDDLMAWKFAADGLKYWQKRMDELRRVF